MWAWVFRLAAVFNWFAALVLALWPGVLHADADDHFLFRMLAMFVALFGYMYWCVATDPARVDYVWFGLIGKVIGVSLLWWHTLAGVGSQNLAVLAIGDLPFIVLFALFLARQKREVTEG